MAYVEKTDYDPTATTAVHVERALSIDATAGVENFKDAHSLDTIEDTKPGAFVWLCAAATGIGGMLFGYDTGVISGVLVVIGNALDNNPLSSCEKELIIALCAAGALIGSTIAGITADKYGRKPAIWFASVLFTIGAIVQATSYTIAQMAIGRVLIGLGVWICIHGTFSLRHQFLVLGLTRV